MRSLVELHGGSVRAESDGIGKGSEFIIELPAAELARSDAEDTSHSVPVARPKGRARRVLVVDDNADAVETLKSAIEALG